MNKRVFRISGKVEDVVEVLKVLSELEWECPNLLSLLLGKVISLTEHVTTI